MGSISKNFSWNEFEKTSYADLQEKNLLVNEEYKANCKALVDTVLQPLRDALGYALVISSGYRCKELNERVGGSATSQHLTASASDVYTYNDQPYDVAKKVKDLGLPYDQMILYPTFVHLSHKREGSQRGQILHDKSYVGERL